MTSTKISTSEKLAEFDTQLRKKYGPILVATDEAGRGAVAGPISAGAVILPSDAFLPGLNDSKQMTHEDRVIMAKKIKEVALSWSVAYVSVDEINAVTGSPMTWANGEVMRRAVFEAVAILGPDVKPDLYILDQFNQRATSPAAVLNPFIMASKMDGTSLSCAAASVLAKVGRDEFMVKLHEQYPQYGFNINKGYVRPDHIEAMKTHGRNPVLHRMSYQIEGVNKPKQYSLMDFLSDQEESIEE